jgi:hypothetical protein
MHTFVERTHARFLKEQTAPMPTVAIQDLIDTKKWKHAEEGGLRVWMDESTNGSIAVPSSLLVDCYGGIDALRETANSHPGPTGACPTAYKQFSARALDSMSEANDTYLWSAVKDVRVSVRGCLLRNGDHTRGITVKVCVGENEVAAEEGVGEGGVGDRVEWNMHVNVMALTSESSTAAKIVARNAVASFAKPCDHHHQELSVEVFDGDQWLASAVFDVALRWRTSPADIEISTDAAVSERAKCVMRGLDQANLLVGISCGPCIVKRA